MSDDISSPQCCCPPCLLPLTSASHEPHELLLLLIDHTDDRRSIERKLPQSMFLIVKRNREEQAWQFPQGRLLDSETNLRAVSCIIRDGRDGRKAIGNMTVVANNHDCHL